MKSSFMSVLAVLRRDLWLNNSSPPLVPCLWLTGQQPAERLQVAARPARSLTGSYGRTDAPALLLSYPNVLLPTADLGERR